MNYELAIFDFDGTLADSLPFFMEVFNELADRHGFRRVAPEEVPALRRCEPSEIMRRVGMPAWKLPVVAGHFMRLMAKNRASIRMFEGIPEALHELAASGMTLAIVSSNSDENVSHVLGAENTRLISRFECGVSISGKASRIARVLRKTGTGKSGAIYVGDQKTDLDAARDAGVAFAAVAWGYADVASLEAHAPEKVFRAVSELTQLAGR